MDDIRTHLRTQNINNKTVKSSENRRKAWWARQDLNLRPIRYERSSSLSNRGKSSHESMHLIAKRLGKCKTHVPNTHPIIGKRLSKGLFYKTGRLIWM